MYENEKLGQESPQRRYGQRHAMVDGFFPFSKRPQHRQPTAWCVFRLPARAKKLREHGRRQTWRGARGAWVGREAIHPSLGRCSLSLPLSSLCLGSLKKNLAASLVPRLMTWIHLGATKKTRRRARRRPSVFGRRSLTPQPKAVHMVSSPCVGSLFSARSAVVVWMFGLLGSAAVSICDADWLDWSQIGRRVM